MTLNKLLSREELIGGMGGRSVKRASALLALIENRTAHLLVESAQTVPHVTPALSYSARAQFYLSAFTQRNESSYQPTIGDLEQQAAGWAELVPENPAIRAGVAQLLGKKYRFTSQMIPALSAALGLHTPEVQAAYQKQYAQPLSSIYIERLGWREQVARVFNLELSEVPLVLLLGVHSFAIGITVSFFFTAASAIYLTEFSPSSLPYIYILTGGIVTTLGLILSKLEQRVSQQQFLTGLLLVLSLSVSLLYLMLTWFQPRWLIFSLLIWHWMVETPLYMAFWAVATRLFTVHQAKRLFGLISSGEFASRILAGFSIPLLLQWLDTPDLLLFAAFGLFLSLGLLLVIIRQYPTHFAAPQVVAHPRKEEPAEKEASPSNKSLLADPYLRIIFLMLLLSIASNYFIDFVLFEQLHVNFPEPKALASFMALFWSSMQIVVFLSTTFVSGRLISRYGVNFGLWILPFILTTALVLVALIGLFNGTIGLFFWVVVFAKACEEVLRFTFEKPSLRMLYIPIDVRQRLAVQIAIEGRGIPLGAGFAGIVLLLWTFSGVENITILIVVMVLIFLLWIALAVRVCGEYFLALKKGVI